MSARYDPASPNSQRAQETVTRTFKILRFDPHPRRKILIIRGEILVTVCGPLDRDVIAEETREFKKAMRFESLTETTNSDDIVDEVLEQCPFIADEFVRPLLAAIDILKHRKYDHHGMAILPSDDDGSLPSFSEYFEDYEIKCDADMKEVKMDSLDLYLELLYEGLTDKVQGARCLWRLASVSDNLLIFYNHDTALNAIFRTLREDFKKSLELTTNLLGILASLAKYRDFHPVLITNKICSITIKIIDFELERHRTWFQRLKEQKETIDSEPESNPKAMHEFQKQKLKFTELVRKQDSLLTVGFEIIQYFCERKSFIQQLHKKGIVNKLMQTLERSNIKLLIVTTSFLRNMAIYKEYCVEMAEFNIAESLMKLLNRNIPCELLKTTTALIYNLTFGTKLRHKMLRLDYIAKIASFYHDPEIQSRCLLIMYNFSFDHVFRPKFVSADVIPALVKRLLHPGEKGTEVEVVALVLNLAFSKRCSQTICENNQLSRMVKLALQTQDMLLMKIVRKISEHEGPTKGLFTDLINNIVGAIRENAPKEFLAECFGTLSNTSTIPHVDFCELMQSYQFLPFLRAVLEKVVPKSRRCGAEKRSPEESLLLEVIIFIGSCAGEPGCSDFLIQHGIAELLYKHASFPRLDPKVRVQVFYAFYRLGCHTNSRTYLVDNTEIPSLLRNFINIDIPELREVATAAWNVLGEHNEDWKDYVRTERFLAHSATWFEMIGQIKEVESEEYRYFKELQAKNVPEPKALRTGPSVLEIKKAGAKKKMRAKTSGSTSESLFSDNSEESQESSDGGDDGDEYNDHDRNESGESDEDDEGHNPVMHMFDQFRHQYNQEMQERSRHIVHSDDEEAVDEEDDLGDGYGRRNWDDDSTPRLVKNQSESRPQTAKSRPATAAAAQERISRLQQK